MTVQQGNTFYEATRDVFKMMLGLDIAQLETHSAMEGEETVQVAIELIGDLTGSVVYSFPKTTTLNIVKRSRVWRPVPSTNLPLQCWGRFLTSSAETR